MSDLKIDEIDDELSLTRSALSSGTSFACSMIFHLGILLILAFAVRATYSPKSISLQANLDPQHDLSTHDAEFELELPEESLETDVEIEPEIESLPVQTTLDESFESEEPLDDIFSLDADLMKEVGGGRSKGKSEGSGKSGGNGFFGITATGKRVVYVIDMSPSMVEGYGKTRYEKAITEVMNSVDQLESDQSFFVYLFCFKTYPMRISRGEYCLPTKENKRKLWRWLSSRNLESGTDPREAVVAALRTQPTCLFLLSDGEFNGRSYGTGLYGRGPSTIELARLHNENSCPIHTIGLEDAQNQAVMKQIATDSGGIYKFVDGNN